MLLDQGLELDDEVVPRSEREVCVDPFLEGLESCLFQASGFVANERLEGEILQRPTTPEGKSGSQLLRPLGKRRVARLGYQALEPSEVEVLRIDAEYVTRGLRHNQLGPDRLPEAGDIVLERRAGSLRGVRPPDLVDQAVARDQVVRVQQQEREQGSQTLAVERNAPAVLGDRKRSENAKFDGDLAFLTPQSPDE
jgi:hypothetical protein